MVMLMDMATGDTETTDGHHDADGANSMRPSPSIQAPDSQQQLGSPAVGAWPGCSIGDHRQHDGWMIGNGRRLANSHQQTGFTAGTIADDDELSANLSHDVCC